MNIFTFASNHPLLTTALIVALFLLVAIVLGVRALIRQHKRALAAIEDAEAAGRVAEAELKLAEVAEFDRRRAVARIEFQIANNNALIAQRKKLKKRGLGVKDLRQANTALRNRTLELAAQ